MAFEAEVTLALLLRLAEVNIDNAAATLDRADRKTLATAEAADGARRELKLALNDGDWVELLESDLAQIENVNLFV